MILRPAVSRLLIHPESLTPAPGTYDARRQHRVDSAGKPIVGPPETLAERGDDRDGTSVDLGEIETAAGRDDKGRPPIETRADRDDPKLQPFAFASEILTKAARDDRGAIMAQSEILTEAARDDDKLRVVLLAGLAGNDLVSGTTGY